MKRVIEGRAITVRDVLPLLVNAKAVHIAFNDDVVARIFDLSFALDIFGIYVLESIYPYPNDIYEDTYELKLKAPLVKAGDAHV